MKYLITGILYLFLMCACSGKHSHENSDPDHSGHNHTAQADSKKSAHDHSDHEHSHDHGECDHDHDDGHEHDHVDEHNHDHTDCDHDHAQEGNTGSGESHTDEIEFSPEKAKEVGIAVEEIKKGTFNNVIKASGKILTIPSDEQTITANVAGVVSFSMPLAEGVEIQKGNRLFTVSSEYLSEGDPVQKARIAYETAKKDYERAASLVESKIVSEKEYNEAKQVYETARIGYEKLASRNTGKGQGIPAPASGFIKQVLVKELSLIHI